MHGAVRQHAPALRLLDRAFDQAQILGVGLALVEVGAVDRKASDDLDERPPERVHGEITGVAVGIGDALQVRDQDLELAREARLEHLGLGAAQKPAVGALARHDPPVERVERRLRVGVDERAVDQVQDVVAGGAGDRPAPQRFARLEDLLDDDVEPRPDLPLQRLDIGGGVGKPIDMIDAQPVDPAFADEAEHRFVRTGEDLGFLDAQPGEAVDVEETTIVDVARRHAPMG